MSTYLVRIPTLTYPSNIPADLGLIQADINTFLNQVQNRVLGGTAAITLANASQASKVVTFPRALISVPSVVAVCNDSIAYYASCVGATPTGFTLECSHYQGALNSGTIHFNWIAVVQG